MVIVGQETFRNQGSKCYSTAIIPQSSRMPCRQSHLGSQQLELHRQHYGEQQKAPDHAGAAGVCVVNDVRLSPIRKPDTVQDGVLEGCDERKVPEVCPEREQQLKKNGTSRQAEAQPQSASYT